jgi:hypothetical protein
MGIEMADFGIVRSGDAVSTRQVEVEDAKL